MKKIYITLFASLLTAYSISAQIVEIKNTKRLLAGTESDIFFPQISADGNEITFSSANNENPRRLDLVDGVTTRLKADQIAAARQTEISTVGSEIIISRNGRETRLSPVECYAGYVWASLSPDAEKIAFLAAGKGVYVVDLNGKILAELGNYEAPAWLGNNAIVAMKATDDGHQITSSQIVAIDIDTKEVQPLTRPESMTMFPTASADGSKIVYNSIDGRLFLMEVAPEK